MSRATYSELRLAPPPLRRTTPQYTDNNNIINCIISRLLRYLFIVYRYLKTKRFSITANKQHTDRRRR